MESGGEMFKYRSAIIEVLNHLAVLVEAAFVFPDSAATRLVHFFRASLCGGKTVRFKTFKLHILFNPPQNTIILPRLCHSLPFYDVSHFVTHANSIAKSVPIDK